MARYAVAPGARAALLRSTLEELRGDAGTERLERRLRAVAAVQQALDRLATLDDPAELLDRAPVAACNAGDFARCVVSRVDGTTWVVAGAHVVGDQASAAAFVAERGGRRTPLDHAGPEGDMLRRRSAVLVADAGAPGPLPPGAASYVAAPIVVRDRVVGFLHADHATRPVAAIDRDVLAAFAEGFGQLHERAVLVARLGAQHHQVRQMALTTGLLLDELCDADIDLVQADRKNGPVARTAATMFSAPEVRIEQLLTRRELEVLALMSEGVGNAVVAERLVISEGTVKTHVKHILRKLRASNRAEAVARYLNRTVTLDRQAS